MPAPIRARSRSIRRERSPTWRTSAPAASRPTRSTRRAVCSPRSAPPCPPARILSPLRRSAASGLSDPEKEAGGAAAQENDGDAELLPDPQAREPAVEVVEEHGGLAAEALELPLVLLGDRGVVGIGGVADDDVRARRRLLGGEIDRRAGAQADDQDEKSDRAHQMKTPRRFAPPGRLVTPGSRPRYTAGLPYLGLPPQTGGGSSVRVLPAGVALVFSHGITSFQKLPVSNIAG